MQIPAMGSMQEEKEEMHSLLQEKRQIEDKLSAAGGKDSGPLLALCSDFLDIVYDISSLEGKRGEIEHSAFMTKVKFSRKVRRKAKDLGIFEQELVSQYDLGHISLGHARKMADAIKFLRSGKAPKAREQAEEFYSLAEIGERRKEINGILSKRQEQLIRAKREAQALLSDFEWLLGEPPPDLAAAGRHIERQGILSSLENIRSSHIDSLMHMPLALLLKKMQEEKLWELGFPILPPEQSDQLLSFLGKFGLESKSAPELLELSSQSQQKLGHIFQDAHGFRRDFAAHRAFLEKVASPSSHGFLSMELADPRLLSYLSAHSQQAREAAGRLPGLEATAHSDRAEWARANKISEKKAALSGRDKSSLQKSLEDILALERALEGGPQGAEAEENKKGKGLLDSLLSLFGRKN